MMDTKILVVYYSESGRTERIGEELAYRCGADHERLRDAVPREDWSGRLRTAWQVMMRSAAPILPVRCHPEDYDLVVVGTPVWRTGPAAPIRRYLRQHAGSFRQVAFFCVSAHSGAENAALGEMQALCGRAPLASVALFGSPWAMSLLEADRLRRFTAALHGEREADQEAASPEGPPTVPDLHGLVPPGAELPCPGHEIARADLRISPHPAPALADGAHQ